MKDNYINFNETRMQIFGELVSRYWNGSLHTISDLDALVNDIKVKYGFEDSDLSFIRDHVRIAMGQAPRNEPFFSDELDLVKDGRSVERPVVARISGPCLYCDNNLFDCGQCVSSCDFGAIADKIEFLPLIDILKDPKTPVYVTVAPAIAGQLEQFAGDESFGKITMGQLRSALKLMGFQDMLEVALFADILTIKEAYLFDQLVKTEEDFFLTSCCCPVWVNLIKSKYPEIFKHLSLSVSPMIASGRILKHLYPDALVVFVGPCIAKKAEAKEANLKDAIDFVLNFRELQEIFKALDIHPQELPGDEKDQASFGGRIYARTGGVSFSVKTVVNRIAPSRVIKLKSEKVDGVKNCKRVLDDLRDGEKTVGNFIEGMGCLGGCVGGPRAIANVDEATRLVNEFGEDSFILTPFDNMNVMKILKQFGIESIDDFLKSETLNGLLSACAPGDVS
jgi:iron only hydrogenase large subunit-like protein